MSLLEKQIIRDWVKDNFTDAERVDLDCLFMEIEFKYQIARRNSCKRITEVERYKNLVAKFIRLFQ